MSKYKDEIRAIIAAGMNNQENERQASQEQDQQSQQDKIEDIYVLIVREHEEVEEEQSTVVESVPLSPPVQPSQPFPYLTLSIVLLCCLPMLASIMLQVYMLLNPPIATVTIIPTSQTVTLNGTLQLGRLLNPITISQSQTTPTTGKGHQDARSAVGAITFYNGQFQHVTIAAGTILTGASGVQIVTDQDATIPAGKPPSYGQVTVSAHAVSAGSRGNIAADDINEACCAVSVLVKNTSSFYNGQDERTFSTVTQPDIHSVSTVLKSSLKRSIAGALQGQLSTNEQLQLLPCNPTVTSDKQAGDEAIQVKVTVSLTCSAIAYNSQELTTKVTTLLNNRAITNLGSGYSLFGDIQVKVNQASVTHPNLVFLSFKVISTWIYGLSYNSQQQIKRLLAGKSADEAKALLTHDQGIQNASIQLDGLTDRIPKNSNLIDIVVLYKPA